jgi:hypothetical protein
MLRVAAQCVQELWVAVPLRSTVRLASSGTYRVLAAVAIDRLADVSGEYGHVEVRHWATLEKSA